MVRVWHLKRYKNGLVFIKSWKVDRIVVQTLKAHFINKNQIKLKEKTVWIYSKKNSNQKIVSLIVYHLIKLIKELSKINNNNRY